MNFKTLFWAETQRLFTSPKRLLMTFGLPLLVMYYFSSVFKADVPKDLPIAVLNYDNSAMSRQLVRFLESSPSLKIVTSNPNPQEAEKALRIGEIYGYVVIPTSFEKDILQGKTAKVVGYINGNFTMPASLVQGGIMGAVGTLSAGISIQKKMKQGTPEGWAKAEIQSVRTDSHSLYNPYKNFNFFLNLAFIPLLFHMVVMTMSIFALGQMFKHRNAQHYLALGGGYWSLLLGKMLPYTLVFLALGGVMNFVLFRVIGIPLSSETLLPPFLVVALLVVVMQSMAVFFVVMMKDLRTALSTGGLIAGMAFSFTGYTFPVESMPLAFQYLSNIFPYRHFIEMFVDVAIKGLGVEYWWGNLLAMGLFISSLVFSFPKFINLVKQNGYENDN